ncbi:hypothetical protein AAHA92_09782 [Salvia divinorum]|uniref:Uncharacterized protein n=1 Tax=Salvia divinorum TaxID=28513 RepID=A0ABD1HSH1_SALDI
MKSGVKGDGLEDKKKVEWKWWSIYRQRRQREHNTQRSSKARGACGCPAFQQLDSKKKKVMADLPKASERQNVPPGRLAK